MSVRQFPDQAERVETGVIQFGDDWPGVFIRGDNALHYAHVLKAWLDGKAFASLDVTDVFDAETLRSLAKLLDSCRR